MNFKNFINKSYKFGFKTDLSSGILKGGLNNFLIENLRILNNESSYILEFRKKSLKKLINLRNPDWTFFESPDINYDNLVYYSIPKNINKINTKTLLKETFEKLGILDTEREVIKNNSIDIIFDSVSIFKTIKPFLAKSGIIFMSLFESLKKFPYIVKKYFGTVVSSGDNFYSALNSIVFSEGSFCYIPQDIYCEFSLTTYFRTNTENFAQFERTLLIVGENSYISYLEGCTAPIYKETQLHVAIVEIIVKYNGYVKYSTIQNWYKGNIFGEGGLYNFTTKRGICYDYGILDWMQVEMGSAITWKYPSTILKGNYSKSNFYSISFISELQIADTGSKLYHLGNFSSSRILSKSITLGSSINIYRGLVEIGLNSFGSLNKTECDSLLVGNESLIITIPYTKVFNYTSNVQQEAYISKIDEILVFFLNQRGLNIRVAITLLVNGFCASIYDKLPIEIAYEIPKLVFIKTENIFTI